MRYYKIIGGIARRLPASSTWIAPDDIFEYNGDLTGTGWAEEVEAKYAKVLFSDIEQKDEEPKDEVIEPDPEEEEKPKRKYKK